MWRKSLAVRPGLSFDQGECVAQSRDRLGIDTACLEHRQREPLSHDNVYHSLLSLANVRTAVYRPERDLLRPCRT